MDNERQGKSVLVVDDHPVNRRILVGLLKRHGYAALEARNGAEALTLARAERPRLVISDILMPAVDGFELVRRLRADPVISATPVIFCSATYREPEAQELARTGGVFRVLPKPFRPAEMLDAIEKALAAEPVRMPGVGGTFDRDHLRLMTDKLSQQEAALRRAQRVARLAHVITRADGTFEQWSETLGDLTGLDDENLPRTTRDWLDLVHPDHRGSFRAVAINTARARARTQVEYLLRHADGEWRAILQVMEPMGADEGGEGDGRWFSILQDVTAQKRAEEEVRQLAAELEQRVADRTSELRAAMKELESFDYSISHDLRAPINHIRGFVEILLEDHLKGLDEEGGALLRRVASAADRMERLVEDLFQLSVVSRGDFNPERVDLSAIAQEVGDALARSHLDRKVVFSVEPGLVARADPGLLRILFENLLGNAWKFTRRREEARIEVGLDPAQTTATFFVRDNGAGFDPSHAERLFAPFKRLHTKGEFEGTGIGLATVSRIVVRHGGRVWAEGVPEAGATLRFTLGA